MTRSFGLDAASALRVLTDDARKFADGEFRDELNVVLARDCAIKAWHLCEHAFQVESVADRFPTLRSLQDHVKEQCPDLAYLQEVCNETKHARITKPDPCVADTWSHGGDFSSRDWHPDDFDTPQLRVQLVDGRVLAYRTILQRAVAFWQDFFQAHGIG